MKNTNSANAGTMFATNLIKTLFTDIAALSESVIDKNNRKLMPGGFPAKDRVISADKLKYLTGHFGVIYLGLISNDVFRDSFKDAVAVEISLEEKNDEEFERSIRKDMQTEASAMNSKRRYVRVDLSKYDSRAAEALGKRIGDSLGTIAAFEQEFNELVDELTEDDFIEIGFIVSNYAYLLKAFQQNDLFYEYVRDVIGVVKKELNLDEIK